MKILADFHHGDLFESLLLLLEERLGHEVYRPYGLEWWSQGYWTYNARQDIANQMLCASPDVRLYDDYYKIYDPCHGVYHKGVSFEQFKEQKFDIVIASVNQHESIYSKLVQTYQPQAKLVRQLGNVFDQFDPSICRNILASVLPFDCDNSVNVVFYHQEFDLQKFEYTPTYKKNTISNFMNCVPDSRDYGLYKEYKRALLNFNFKMYGILGDDGILGTQAALIKQMKAAQFFWHVKFGGDGFGHVIHNAFALGKPPITRASHYAGKNAGRLMEDLKTCIDLDKRTMEENVKIIREYSEPQKYKQLSENAHQRFTEIVDYEKEAKNIQLFLNKLK